MMNGLLFILTAVPGLGGLEAEKKAEAPGSPDCSLSTVFIPSFPRVPMQEYLEQFLA